MSLTSILVHLSSDRTCQQRLDVACNLVQAAGGRIQGCYFQASQVNQENHATELVMAPDGLAWAPEPSQNAKQLACEDLAVVKELLSTQVAGLENIQWHTPPGEMHEHLNNVALPHELVILSAAYFDGFKTVDISSALPNLNHNLSSPLLILTENLMPGYLPKHPLIIWDNSAEAARTVKQALPILRASGQVSLLSTMDNEDGNDVVALEELAALLRLSNIEINAVSAAASSRPLATAIAETVVKNNNDLVVLGYTGDSVFQHLLGSKLIDQLLEEVNTPLLLNN